MYKRKSQDKILIAYYSSRSRALKHNLEFLFIFEDWCQWWLDQLGPDWQQKRGRKRGQYVMARIGDRGPYAPWNVKCITTEDNLKEGFINRPSRPYKLKAWGHLDKFLKVKRRLKPEKIKEVLAIFHAPGTFHEVAAQFNTTRGKVYQIKTGRIYQSVTVALVKGMANSR